MFEAAADRHFVASRPFTEMNTFEQKQTARVTGVTHWHEHHSFADHALKEKTPEKRPHLGRGPVHDMNVEFVRAVAMEWVQNFIF